MNNNHNSAWSSQKTDIIDTFDQIKIEISKLVDTKDCHHTLLNNLIEQMSVLEKPQSHEAKMKEMEDLVQLHEAAVQFKQFIPNLAGDDAVDVMTCIIKVIRKIGGLVSGHIGVLMGTFASLLSVYLGVFANTKGCGIDALVKSIKWVLTKYHSNEIKERIGPVIEQFQHFQHTMNDIEEKGELTEKGLPDFLDSYVENTFGVPFLDQLIDFLKSYAEDLDDEEKAVDTLRAVTTFTQLHCFRLMLLFQKLSILMRIGHVMAIPKLLSYINQEIGQERQEDIEFLHRPFSAKGAILTSVYRRSEWKCISQYLHLIGVTEPVISITNEKRRLQVQKWSNAYVGKGELVSYMTPIENGELLQPQTEESLENVYFVSISNAAEIKFQLTKFNEPNEFSIIGQESESRKIYSLAQGNHFPGGSATNIYLVNEDYSQSYEVLLVKVILTKDNRCLLASINLPDHFLIMAKQGGNETNLNLKQGDPGAQGYWKMELMCNGEHIKASKFNTLTREYSHDDCAIQ